MPFLAMELLDGQSLADRLERGRCRRRKPSASRWRCCPRCRRCTTAPIVHRDLKPSNVFLSPHGVKLLDFGLARPVIADGRCDGADDARHAAGNAALHVAGAGARRRGRCADGSVRGRLACCSRCSAAVRRSTARAPIEMLHAVIHDHPPALAGSLAIVDADRVDPARDDEGAGRALPDGRGDGADLRACLSRGDLSGERHRAGNHAPHRPAVPHPAARPGDRLPGVQPGGCDHGVALGSRVTGRALEPRRVAVRRGPARYADHRERSGGRCDRHRIVACTRADGCASACSWSKFRRARSCGRTRPRYRSTTCSRSKTPCARRSSKRSRCRCRAASSGCCIATCRRAPRRTRHYLRANRLSDSSAQWMHARESYQRAVEADPSYAPAWARFGRCLRVMSKYSLGRRRWSGGPRPRKRFSARFASTRISRSRTTSIPTWRSRAGGPAEAVPRLLGRVRERTSDPELYAGLVHACRYVGLLDASVAAFHRAKPPRSFDPHERRALVLHDRRSRARDRARR